jgi:hypothetical protein
MADSILIVLYEKARISAEWHPELRRPLMLRFLFIVSGSRWRLSPGLLLMMAFQLFAAGQKEFRAARSVHLGYPAPEGLLFYNEVVVEESVNGSYFMACGWNTGYFGIQQLGGAEDKVVLFSVWDPTKGDDPNAVKTEDRVEVLFQADDVRIKRFGGEGTGGQCMWKHNWPIGQTNRFLIAAKVEEQKTAYTAWFGSGNEAWKKLATFRVRTGGKPLSGYYSFIEDFRRDGKSAQELRRARFGNGWVRQTAGKWTPLTRARFTASNAEWESKENIDAGLEGAWFYLATGGKIKSSRELKTVIESAPTSEIRDSPRVVLPPEAVNLDPQR